MRIENKNISNDKNLNKKESEEKAEMQYENEEVKKNATSQNEALNKSGDNELKEAEITAETLIKERNEINDKYIRLAAEFSNYRRRTENEKSDIYSYANEKIISDLLNVLDNFDRALASVETENPNPLLDGVKLIFKQFSEVLESYGLAEIKSNQCEFDPNFHHAVMRECVEGVDSNRIIQVLQKGYSLNGKVVRPSMVKVAE